MATRREGLVQAKNEFGQQHYAYWLEKGTTKNLVSGAKKRGFSLVVSTRFHPRVQYDHLSTVLV